MNFPNTMMIGYNEDLQCSDIAVGEIRVDSIEVPTEEISRWHLYGKQFYDPLDFVSYVY
jgi:hypothetical protein